MNEPLEQDITVYQGSDFELAIQIQSNGLNTKFTGCTGRGQIRQTVGSAIILASFTFSLEDNDETLLFKLDSATTTALPVPAQTTNIRVNGEYAYDVEIVYPSLVVERIAQGVCFVSPEVTR